MLELGKDPGQAEGYSQSTTKQRSYRLDRFYRWLWDGENGYTLNVTVEDADEYMQELAVAEHSNTYKASLQKSLKMLFNWLKRDENFSIEWSPDISFSESSSSANPWDAPSSEVVRVLGDPLPRQ
jgi:site-specific recombinase XerD